MMVSYAVQIAAVGIVHTSQMHQGIRPKEIPKLKLTSQAVYAYVGTVRGC